MIMMKNCFLILEQIWVYARNLEESLEQLMIKIKM
jgi:hypothetical protein